MIRTQAELAEGQRVCRAVGEDERSAPSKARPQGELPVRPPIPSRGCASTCGVMKRISNAESAAWPLETPLAHFSTYSHAMELGIVFVSLLFVGPGSFSIDGDWGYQGTPAREGAERPGIRVGHRIRSQLLISFLTRRSRDRRTLPVNDC